MAPSVYSVTFTVGLIDKLAGIKAAEPPRPNSAPGMPGSGRALMYPEMLAVINSDVQLNRALTSSRRVGNMLLKQEDEEARKIDQLADDLVKQYSFEAKPMPCQAEREACLDCYKQNPQDALKCGSHVAAYLSCAEKAYEQYVRRV